METGVLQRFLERAKELWRTPLGKVLAALAGSLLVAGILFGVLYRKPPMDVLGTFDPKVTSEVVAKLSEKKIPFQQAGAGYTIMVPRDDLNAARLALAEAGLSDDIIWTAVPWDTMSAWNATDRDKRINYKQLVEQDLGRAIRTLSKVENAKVIISLPEQALYARDTNPPKASVIIEPKRNQQLSADEVRGIRLMVSAAVDGLSEESVVVMDSVRNRIISDMVGTDEVGSASDAFRIQATYQDALEKRLTERLEQVVGPGNVSVIVTVDLDWDKLLTEALTYTDQKPLSTEEVRKSSEGSGGGGSGQPQGIDANTAEAPTYRGDTGGGNFTTEESSRIINYLVGQERVVTEKLPGSVNEIAVAVFVNEAKVNADQTAVVQEMVEAAVGNKAGRIQVAAMRFDSSLTDMFTEEPEPAPAPPNYVLYGVLAGVVLAAILFAIISMRKRRQEAMDALAMEEYGGLTVADVQAAAEEEAMPIRIPTTLEELAQMPPEEVALLGDEFLERLGVDPVKMRIRERVERLARQNPEAVASLLKTWISEE